MEIVHGVFNNSIKNTDKWKKNKDNCQICINCCLKINKLPALCLGKKNNIHAETDTALIGHYRTDNISWSIYLVMDYFHPAVLVPLLEKRVWGFFHQWSLICIFLPFNKTSNKTKMLNILHIYAVPQIHSKSKDFTLYVRLVLSVLVTTCCVRWSADSAGGGSGVKMEGNRDEAEKCINIATKALEAGDKEKALKFLNKAEKLYPTDRAKGRAIYDWLVSITSLG